MSRILVYTSPAKGHLFPVLSVASVLAERGHAVHVRTLASEVDRLRSRGLQASPIDARIEARTLDDWKARTSLGALKLSMRTFADRAPLEVQDLELAIADFAPDGLIVDANTWGAQATAEASSLPWAIFQPYFTPLPAPGVPPFGPGLPPATGPMGRLRDAALSVGVTGGLTRLMLPAMNEVRSRVGLPDVVSLEDALTRADRVLYFTLPELEYERPAWPPSYRFVGPGFTSDGEAPVPTIATDRPIVLATCSTERQNDRDLIANALSQLTTAGYFVVATTGAQAPAAFGDPGEHAVVHRFLPHESVLAVASATLCHGGMGITQRSLAAGVPVVVVPFGRDQLEVARRIEHAHVGVRLARRRSATALADAVTAAEAMRPVVHDIARRIMTYGGGGTGANVVESMLLDSNSSARA